MTKYNTYGFKLTGLRKAVSESKKCYRRGGCRGHKNSTGTIDIYYDFDEDRIYGVYRRSGLCYCPCENPKARLVDSYDKPLTIRELSTRMLFELVDHYFYNDLYYGYESVAMMEPDFLVYERLEHMLNDGTITDIKPLIQRVEAGETFESVVMSY